ncbi:MAG: hypothetical protein QOG52_2509 [Frankiaceae bacterium]|nr:hypothetical protein [Frankiaceae bacterium]
MPNNDRAQRRLNAKRAAKQNRHQLEALRREQARRERRRFIIVTGIVVLVGFIIVGSVTIPSYVRSLNSPSHKSLASYGTSAAAATCDAATLTNPEPGPPEAKTSADADRYHLTTTPSTWKYKNNPPASGPHDPNPMPSGPHYYAPTAASEPSFVEQLVHNLEHGYVVLWYDDTIAQDKAKLQAIDDMGTNLQANGHDLFIAAPWPKDRPVMDGGKHVAITAWHYRQLCNDISGAVLDTFVNTHSPLCAPEPPADPDTGLAATAEKVTATCGSPTPTPSPSTSSTTSSTATSTATPTGTGTASTTPSATKSPTPTSSAS